MNDIRMSHDSHSDLLNAERELLTLLPTIDKAEECGIDCQEFRKQISDRLEQSKKLKQHFAPLPPVG